MADHPVLTATREKVIETFIRGIGSTDNLNSSGRAVILALFDAYQGAVEERKRLRAALLGLQYKGEPDRFCDHAAAPCPRCDAATAALIQGE